MKRKLFLSIMFLLTIFVGIGFTQGKGRMPFGQLDTDSDSKISREEFQMPP